MKNKLCPFLRSTLVIFFIFVAKIW